MKFPLVCLSSLLALIPVNVGEVLKFGDTDEDYVMIKPDMQPFTEAFSVCSWIRKWRSGTDKTWFSYAASKSLSNEIFLHDDGGRNTVFGSHGTNVRSGAGVEIGEWYHYCLAWSFSSNRADIYHDGSRSGSVSTPGGRKLTANGYIVLGQDQDDYGGGFESRQAFGGELYKLNVFSKKLSTLDVGKMYMAGRCSDIEKELYNDTRQLKWEEILRQPRAGNVKSTDDYDCFIEQHLLVELDYLRTTLNATQTELEETKKSKEEISERLNETLTELEGKEEELEEVKAGLSRQACFTNTSHWDVLYTTPFFNKVLTAETLNILNRSWEKLGYFKGTLITESLITFFKTYFYDGHDNCEAKPMIKGPNGGMS